MLISSILFCVRTHASDSNTWTHVVVGDHDADRDAIQDVAVLATLRIRTPAQREWEAPTAGISARSWLRALAAGPNTPASRIRWRLGGARLVERRS